MICYRSDRPTLVITTGLSNREPHIGLSSMKLAADESEIDYLSENSELRF